MPAKFDQASRALDIRTNERRGIENRAIHVRFGGKVHNGIKSAPREQVLQLTGIGNVAAHKLVARVPGHFFQVPEISGVREEVVIHDVDVFTCS